MSTEPATPSEPMPDPKRSPPLTPPLIARAPPDLRSLIGGLAGAALFFALALLSLSLSRFDTSLATVWLPNAGAVAFLLRARLGNEIGFYAAAFPASLLANTLGGNAVDTALVFSTANMATVILVTWLTRRGCGPEPDMTNLTTLARFLWNGGVIGPLTSACIASLAMSPGLLSLFDRGGLTAWASALDGAFSWFLTDSMGMILIVPMVLLVSDALAQRRRPPARTITEGAALLGATLLCVALVFGQNAYPLLFLVVPVTLAHALRLGSVGTALHVALIAVVSTAMTWGGYGPIFEASGSPTVRLHLIQAFIAVNFLIGLPIAATLAGRDRLTEAIAEGRREMALLANSITDAVLKLDGDGVCTYASPAVRDVLGEAPGDFVGRPIRKLTKEDASQRIADAVSRLLKGQVDKERLTYRRRLDGADGAPVFIEADCAITLDPITGEREGVIISARDVTERVELELLLTRARRHAENAANAKSDFLANMSHEIRTPMNGVLGFAELMLQGELDPEQRRHTEMIVESGRSMMLLLNDILDLSKIEAGQIVIDARPIDLLATLEECVALHRQSAKSKGLELRLERDDAEADGLPPGDTQLGGPEAGATVITDGLRLRQIALNLIGNAIKFTERGEVCVSYWANAGELGLRVRDTGIGIGTARLERIFRPFTQGESETARRFGGTGLGLSISRQLAELLGGDIEVESKPGLGSTFTLILPATLVAPEDAPQPEAPKAAIPQDLPQQARILLVEDHDVNRMLVTEMLERCGQNVAIAQDGNEAISMVIDSVVRARPFDLVLMDVQMPNCDGYAATRAIREEGIGADTLPIVALTANAFPEDVAWAREAGMQAHLAKPIVFSDLVQALQRWLPTRIVEAPMDRDVPLIHQSEESEASPEDGMPADRKARVVAAGPPTPPADKDASDKDGMESEADLSMERAREGKSTPGPRLLNLWLERRREAIEAVRKGLADGLIGFEGKRRAQDREDRESLLRLLHKLAGTAGSFGEAELGEYAAELERALRDEGSSAECEALAFDLLALADEPARALPEGRSSQG